VKKLKFLIRWAVAGNALDFRAAGAGYGIATDKIERLIRDNFDNGLSVDEVDRIYVLLINARHIVYLPDNVGELPFDKTADRRMRLIRSDVLPCLSGVDR